MTGSLRLAFMGLILVLGSVAQAEDFILCRYNGTQYSAIKIDLADLEAGKCAVVLPTSLRDFEFRVSRHHNSGLLRLVAQNRKTGFWMRSLGGANEVHVALALADAEGRAAANDLGLTGSQLDELHVGCEPSYGRESEAFLQVRSPATCGN